jgi:hypothetical protein
VYKALLGICVSVFAIAGCKTLGSPIEETTNQPAVASSDASAVTATNAGKRPVCSYGFSLSTNNYSYVPRFYQETKREVGLGNPIQEGAVLFYAQYMETEKIAVADEQIENRDRSPLTANWVWKAREERPVVAMVQADQKSWWYLINSGRYGYWTSDMSGMMCGNVLSFDGRDRLSTALGMSDVYQTQPIRFREKQKVGVPPIAVSVSVKKVTGATASVEINALKAGRAVYSGSETVDLIGGDFSVAGINFSTERKAGATTLKSIAVPEQVGTWLHVRLGIKENKR